MQTIVGLRHPVGHAVGSRRRKDVRVHKRIGMEIRFAALIRRLLADRSIVVPGARQHVIDGLLRGGISRPPQT